MASSSTCQATQTPQPVHKLGSSTIKSLPGQQQHPCYMSIISLLALGSSTSDFAMQQQLSLPDRNITAVLESGKTLTRATAALPGVNLPQASEALPTETSQSMLTSGSSFLKSSKDTTLGWSTPWVTTASMGVPKLSLAALLLLSTICGAGQDDHVTLQGGADPAVQ